ncbi:Serpentine type 7TM GPCR chemoreceptor Srt family protein [Acanthocheilonema viteae]
MVWNNSNETIIDTDQWINETTGKPNIVVGFVYLTTSVIFEIAYLPCLITFFQPDCRYQSCFKLMIAIGIVDMITTINDFTIIGIFSIVGISYYIVPTFSKVSAFISLSCWFAHCSLCVILNFNRCCNLYFGRTVAIFTKSRLWIWIFLAFSYAFVIYSICPPAFYHSYMGVWLSKFSTDNKVIENFGHVFNNGCVIVIISAQYIFMIVILHKRLHTVSDRSNISKPEFHILIQSVIICFLLLACSILYVAIQFIHLPLFMMPFIHISWMFSQGGKSFLYIAMNDKIRRNIGNVLRKR